MMLIMIDLIRRGPLRLAQELVYQLEHAGEKARLLNALTDLPLFMLLYRREAYYEYLAQWNRLRRDGCNPREMFLAKLRRAVDTSHDHAWRVRVLSRAAKLMERAGEWEESAILYGALFTAACESGDLPGQRIAYNGQGVVQMWLGLYDAALVELAEAQRIAEELGDRYGQAVAIGNMGNVYLSRGDYGRAQECFEWQRDICHDLGDRGGLAHAISGMGIVCLECEEYSRALEYFQGEVAIRLELGDRHRIALSIGNMGCVYLALGKLDLAMDCFRRDREICDELGDRIGVGVSEGNMGRVHADLGEYENSIACLARGAFIARESGDRLALARCLGDSSLTLLELLDAGNEQQSWLVPYVDRLDRESVLGRARQMAEECLDIAHQLPLPNEEFHCTMLLARIDAAEGDHDGATSRLKDLVDKVTDDVRCAELHYWLWKLGNGSHYHDALRLYKRLLEKSSKHEYRQRVDELNGEGISARSGGTSAGRSGDGCG